MIEPREQSHEIAKTDDAFVATTFWGVLALLAGSTIAAGLASRGLYQDGAYYLIRMAERDWFYLVDPARTTVQILRQLPVVLLMRTSELSLPVYGAVFSLAMLSLPLLLAIPCWFIPPKGLRGYAIFPVFSLLTGLFTQSIEAVGEAAIATALYWVILFLLVFRTRDVITRLAFLALGASACFLHEGAARPSCWRAADAGCLRRRQRRIEYFSAFRRLCWRQCSSIRLTGFFTLAFPARVRLRSRLWRASASWRKMAEST